MAARASLTRTQASRRIRNCAQHILIIDDLRAELERWQRIADDLATALDPDSPVDTYRRWQRMYAERAAQR